MKTNKNIFKKIGLFLTISGVLVLIAGILLFMFANTEFILWFIVGSVVLNVIGINLLSAKQS